MDLVVLSGLPGVGKLTIGQKMADQTGFRLSHHNLTVDLVHSLFESGSQPFIEFRERIWLAAIQQATVSHLDGLISTLASDRTVRDLFVERIEEIVTQSGGTVQFVELICNREELESCLVQPFRAKFGKLRLVQQLRTLRQKRAFDGPTLPPDRLVVETFGRSAQEVAVRDLNSLGISTILAE